MSQNNMQKKRLFVSEESQNNKRTHSFYTSKVPSAVPKLALLAEIGRFGHRGQAQPNANIMFSVGVSLP